MCFRLIKHTERLLEEKEEKLCIKVLQTLKEMMTVDIDYGQKVCSTSIEKQNYNKNYDDKCTFIPTSAWCWVNSVIIITHNLPVKHQPNR